MNRRKFFGLAAAAPVALASMPAKALHSGGRIPPFARPIGIIGEARPEAILPLKRTMEERLAILRHKVERDIAALVIKDGKVDPVFRDGDGI